ncbi:chaperone modulator CbpM [Moheibacter lacus]|uniref:MerR family transcriptional regulator n=1 Tax=Moheibacter lacus TaxID=2745851 RepID=A0A838ZNT7_9FLAO|nr:chaperone modulator CbpM [Moheibacter lacus]MBA5629406.1 MerR family transcriptional regulator [Moheibacter lacus]
MKIEKLIHIHDLCKFYEVESSFFEQVESYGLIKIVIISNEKYVHPKQLKNWEKIIHLHQDLNVNMEGIDVIFNLMKRIQLLENELEVKRKHLIFLED